MGTVVVVGSVNEDLVLDLPALPVAGETVGGGSIRNNVGGKGANQARVAAGLGARTFFVGCIGADPPGARARRDMVGAGVDDSWVHESSQRPTGVAAVMVGPSGENLIGLAPGANGDLAPEMVEAAIAALADEVAAAVLLVSLEVPAAAAEAGILAAGRRGWTVVVNPAPARPMPAEVLAAVDVLTPNSVEVEQIVEGGVHQLLEAGVGAVVVTRGAHGAEVWRRPGRRERVAAVPAAVRDTTGAGDAFSAALAWALADGQDLLEAVRLGAAAGALAVEVAGTRIELTEAKVRARMAAAGLSGSVTAVTAEVPGIREVGG